MSHQLINQYLAELDRLKRVSGVTTESVVREAFKDLLKAWGKQRDLTFIAEHAFTTTAKVHNRVDGALLHDLRVPFGYWEAKDENDDLDQEIAKKLRRGYPQTNIIFEDSRTAVLIQNGKEVFRCPTTDPDQLERLLELFFGYERPEIADFKKAVSQFKADLPAVLEALRSKIDDAYAGNQAFAKAAAEFLKTARQTINPGVTEADIREMLIQHILTEEVFAHVFNEGDFHRENNIAKELSALESLFFRGDVKRRTLAALEPYYAAIRSTAALVTGHIEKQGFLKALYENFYRVYNPKAADRLGVVYTPTEIVRFMVESANWLCGKHFGKSLIDRDVQILDPATGTGTFIVELLERFRGQPEKLTYKYLVELNANEVAILPYYVANLNIEATYASLVGRYEEFPGLCFVDTLDNVAALGIYSGHQHDLFAAMSDENVERVRKQNSRKISVVIGNPPYNAWQDNYNDRNANRLYKRVDERIRATYVKESDATNSISVYDMYTRFLRWASDRIGKEGVIAFVTNRNFIDGQAMDGVRRVLAREFQELWIVDLGADIRVNPKLSGTRHNVFGIQAGVAISFFVKTKSKRECRIFYCDRPEFETAEEKLVFLSHSTLERAAVQEIKPDKRARWLGQGNAGFDSLMPVASREAKAAGTAGQTKAIFKLFGRGVATQRDDWMWSESIASLESKVRYFTDEYNSSLGKGTPRSDNIKWDRELDGYADKRLKKSFDVTKLVAANYRPFIKKWLYFDRQFNGMIYQNQTMFGDGHRTERAITLMGDSSGKPYFCLAIDRIADLNFVSPASGGTQVLPRSRLDAAGREVSNITDWALGQFAARYGVKAGISKDDIFAYVYAVLHDPVYRETYAVNLKRDLPRVPLYPNFALWRDWGRTLLDLHIGYESAEPWPLERVDTPDPKLAGTGQHPAVKLKSNQETGVIVLDTVTQLGGVPSLAWSYVLGNRCPIDWVLDQHKEKRVKDPTVRERFDAYRFADHKEEIIDLLARVTTVSVRTMEIVEQMRALPLAARKTEPEAA